METDAVVYCDGACTPFNPGGVASYGWVAYWHGKRARDGCGVVCEGDGATNNVAEYSALINALKYFISKNFYGPLLVRSDSQLLVNQMAGRWGVNADNLKPYHQEARRLAERFTEIVFEWIPREKNEPADALSKKAYREYQSSKNRGKQ